MAFKVNILKTTFTGGEIDPRLQGRVETPRYINGAEKILNAVVLVSGGCSRRPGTRFAGNAGSGVSVRLIPFNILKKDATPPVMQGYAVELRSDGKIRFYTNSQQIKSGGTPYEVTGAFAGKDLRKISFDQYDNVLYLMHPEVKPQQTTRTTDTNWTAADVAFTQPPTPHWAADGSTGFPKSITFYDQRMLVGGTKAKPQTVVASKSGAVTDLTTGTGDADGFSYAIAVATSPVYHLAALGKVVAILTQDKEILLKASSDKPLSPTNMQFSKQTAHGCSETVAPLILGSEMLFVTRYGKKVRSFGYRFESDDFRAPDQSMIAAQLLEAGIVETAYSTEPQPIIWAVLSDGRLISCTFDRDQDVVAYSQHSTDGLFKSICVIPGNGKDQLWCAVERTINSVTSTYIEYMDIELHGSGNTDSAYVGSDVAGKATWTGLDHLNGKAVDIVADGVPMPQQTVSAGAVTLPRNAKAVEIGLHYETEVGELPFALQTAQGSTMGMAVSIYEIWVSLYETSGVTINGKEVSFRHFGLAVLDTPVEPLTGTVKMSELGWNDGRISIKQTQPLPFTVLGIVKKVTANDG